MFKVEASGGSYEVWCGNNLFAQSMVSMRDGIVIADEFFAAILMAANLKVIALPALEATKSLEAAAVAIVQLREAAARRDTHLWAVGGGAIQDVSGFVASIFMRGVEWSYLPTTLLGMVDSCIGGKSSINVGPYKNIVGTFHPPRKVVIDPWFTATQSAEQRAGGLVEAAKICYCRGADVFQSYLSHCPHAALSPDQYEPIIALSLGAKKWFVEIDEFDRAERLLLNLGHTFGHALEGASNYHVAHGIAVGVGILCALTFSETLLGAPPRGMALELGAHVRRLLSNVPGLRVVLKAIATDDMIDRIKADKKHEIEHYRFVLFDRDGTVQLTRLRKNAVVDMQLSTAVDKIFQFFDT